MIYNFQIETSFVNLNPLARNPGSAPASTIYFILFTWASPYGTHMEPGYTAHMGAHMGPIWVTNRLLSGYGLPIWGVQPGSAWVPFGKAQLRVAQMGPVWVPYNSPIKKKEMI